MGKSRWECLPQNVTSKDTPGDSSDKKCLVDTQGKLSQLFFAIDEKCHDKVEQILKSGFDVNHMIRSSKNPAAVGRTALHHACDCRNESAVKLLLEFGADFTVKDHNGHTALRLCMDDYKKDEDAIVKLILDAQVGKDNRTNPVDEYNLSHFHIACVTEHTRAISFFKKFCPLDDVIHEGSPILRNFSLPNTLSNDDLQNKSQGPTSPNILGNVCEENSRKRTGDREIDPPDTAAKRPKISNECGDWLPEDISSDPVENLMRTCLNGSPEEVKNILESGTVNLSGEGISEKALCLASHAKSIDNVKVLIEHGANFFVDFAGHQILDLCIKMFGWRVLELLPLLDPLDESCILEKRAREFCLIALNPSNVNLISSDYFDESTLREFINTPCTSSNSRIWRGATPLHLVAKFTYDSEKFGSTRDPNRNEKRHVSSKVLSHLIDNGADFTAQNSHGRTVLHQAFYDTSFEIVRIILKKHQDLAKIKNPVDKRGLSHLHIACILGGDSTLAFLFNHAINVKTRITGEIKLSTKVSAVNVSSGSTPLHSAVSNRDWKTVQWLISRGADIFAEDAYGLTPIHYATMIYEESQADEGWKQIINEFMSHPDIKLANPTLTDGGLSHLQAACATDKVDVIEALVWHGADVNAPPLVCSSTNKNIKKNVFTANTPSLIAYKFDNQKTLEVLAKHGANFNAPNSSGLSCLHLALANWLEGCPRQKVKRIVDLMKFDWKNTAPIDRTGLTQLHVACA